MIKQKIVRKGVPGWCIRHKVLSALFLLIGIGVVAFFVYGYVYDMNQAKAVADDRKAFAVIQKDVYALADTLAPLGEVKKDSYCYYTSNPVEWEKGDRYCGFRVILNVPNMNLTDASKNSTMLADAIRERGYSLKKEKAGERSLLSGSFDVANTYCFVRADHYSSDVPAADRNVDSSPSGENFFTSIFCRKPAQAEYYHLVE